MKATTLLVHCKDAVDNLALDLNRSHMQITQLATLSQYLTFGI